MNWLKVFWNWLKSLLPKSKSDEPLSTGTIKASEAKIVIPSIFRKPKPITNPNQAEAFLPFKSMTLEEWKQHPFHRNGSSYLARLRNYQLQGETK